MLGRNPLGALVDEIADVGAAARFLLSARIPHGPHAGGGFAPAALRLAPGFTRTLVPMFLEYGPESLEVSIG